MTLPQFRKLTPAMKAFYLKYAMTMLAVLESAQNPTAYEINVKDKKLLKKKSRKSAWFNIDLFSKAYAELAGVAIPPQNDQEVVRELLENLERVEPVEEVIVRGIRRPNGVVTTRIVPAQVTASDLMQSMQIPRPTIDLAAVFEPIQISPIELAQVPAPNLDAAPANAEAPSAQAAATPVNPENYRQEGAFCIFGGYGTTYRKRADGRITCPAPRQDYDCEATGKPMFACNTFGIATPSVRAAGCVPLFNEAGNLNDLTARCVNAVSKAVTDAVTGGNGVNIDGDELNKLLNDLQKAIDDYESENGAFQDHKNYCKNQNAVNEGRQKGECEAIQSLIASYKEAYQALNGGNPGAPAQGGSEATQ